MEPNLMDAEYMLRLYESLLLWLTWALATTICFGVLTYLCLFFVERLRYQHRQAKGAPTQHAPIFDPHVLSDSLSSLTSARVSMTPQDAAKRSFFSRHFTRAKSSSCMLLLAAVFLTEGMHTAAQRTLDQPGRRKIPLGLDAYMPIPDDNPITQEKLRLGQTLFNDPLLSRDKSISCASCHDPRYAFTDARTVAAGVFNRRGTRNAPALINRAYGKSHFWDGRASTLEAQVLKPIQDPNEMDMTLEEVVGRLKQQRRYRKQFQKSFRREINADDLARALASYVRTILSGDSPVDHYLNGERGALSEQARQGLNIFRGKGNCTACHLGPNFTDERFHNTGVAWRDGKFLDSGRFAITGRETDRGAFKTPTLREIARTAPYVHDGSLATLEDVIEYYDRGGNPNPHLDAELRPLRLTTEEKQALVAFLKALSGTVTKKNSQSIHSISK